MSAQPPSYDTAMHQRSPHDSSATSSHAHETRAQHLAHSNEFDYSSSSDSDAPGAGAGRVSGTRTKRRQPTREEIDERMSMVDEERELPEGWQRCFDKNSGHAFYVDTRSKPPRSIWQHPYDDPEFIRSLPDTHPANPNSTQAKQARSEYDEMMEKARKQREAKAEAKRSAGGKLKDKILGSTKGEREAKRTEKAARRARQEEEERKARQKYLERRQALMKQQGLAGGDARLYAANPYAYSAPSYPYGRSMYGPGMYGGRSGLYEPRYYGGSYGYGRPYGGMGGMGMGLPLLGGMLLGGALF